MSFADPFGITYNAVAKSLVRVDPGIPYTNDYYLDDDSQRFGIRIAHTIPKSGIGVSHMMRLDVENLDTDYLLTRKDSVWLACRTDSSRQNTTELKYAVNALIGSLTPGNIDKLLARET